MPVYCYRAVNEEESCPHCRVIFEITQRMSEPALEQCPRCSAKVERIMTSFYSYASPKDKLSNKRLKELGFKKYVKDDNGKYTNILDKEK